MMLWSSLRARALVCVAASFAIACSDPPQDKPANNDTGGGGVIFDAGGGGDGTNATDNGGDDDSGSSGGGEAVWLTFEVDDSANKTFADGDIKWTGSFSWDSKTNTVVPATSWLPTDGPYPLLYDDGPISKGGHEKEGATAGDHIFSTAVKFVPSEDTVFEYGALNEFDNWMWIGPNGQLEVKKGATGTLDAKGLVLPKHGDVDLKLEIDTAALNDKFKTWTPKTHKFYAKGTMNMWTPVQLLDDGNKGDAAAADGKLTYVQSENLGKHDGLLSAKDEVQFIFVTTTGDAFPDAGQEYKGATEAYKDGIRAWTKAKGGDWVEATVVLAVDSKGKFKNTAIVVPEGGAPVCEPACKANETCSGGKCIAKGCDPACTPAQVCKDGQCVPKPCDPACKTGETCEAGKCVPKACDPACKSDETCEAGQCVAKTCKPACGSDQKCVVDQCVDLPAIDKVEPGKGPMAGGTKVTITGKGFAAPATVTFGGAKATAVLVKDAKTITCETPAGKTGPVKVEVDVAGDKASKDAAFTYDPPPKPTALLAAPLSLKVEEGQAIKGLTAVVKVPTVSQTPGPTTGMKVDFGVGAPGTDPSAKGANWNWTPAVFSAEDTSKGEETWTADLGSNLPIGPYAFTVRVTYESHVVFGDSNGSEDGLDIKKIGSIEVTKKDTTPKVTGFEPPYLPWTGGTITILGKNLTTDLTVSLKSDHPQFPALDGKNAKLVPGKGVAVTIEPGVFGVIPPLAAALTVTPKGVAKTTLSDKVDVVPVATPTLDGEPKIQDWGGPFLQATAQSEWTGNTLSQLYIAYDKTNLYIGFTGGVESKNAIVAYIDVDYGAGTGVKSPTDLKDNTGSLDNALSNVLKVVDAMFGADFAMGTVGMKSQLTGKPADAEGAGWRSLAKPGDLAWLGGKVVAQASKGVEASLPLKDLFPKGIPAKGAPIAVFVKVVNGDGSVAPKNAALPDQKAGDATTIDTVAKVTVYQLP